jgi:hypothetical protein
VFWGGRRVDRNDTIDKSCEASNIEMGVSRQEFVERSGPALSGGE